MTIQINENNLKDGLLALVLALVEIIGDVLQHQAFRRMEGGRLTEDEVERLGQALLDLEEALEKIKREQGIFEAVRAVRHGLDDVVDDFLDRVMNPARWRD
ncbi:MAG: gas vesicle protein K [Firmicutes bacterium]|nr:gas vesicle protein K [Bacillota bacterium]MCL5040126.1 gas vesicle protein K [Bacillota bacterium]